MSGTRCRLAGWGVGFGEALRHDVLVLDGERVLELGDSALQRCEGEEVCDSTGEEVYVSGSEGEVGSRAREVRINKHRRHAGREVRVGKKGIRGGGRGVIWGSKNLTLHC